MKRGSQALYNNTKANKNKKKIKQNNEYLYVK